MINVTPLGYALMGLLRVEPRSGYALRMVFETTPMGNYSSSPGSIYPALKALQKQGLVEAKKAAKGSVFHLSKKGEEAFEAWLREPVTAEQVAKHMSTVMLRFAFLTGHPEPVLTRNLLTSLKAAATAHGDGMRAWMEGPVGADMPLQARLALEQGIMSVRSVADWAAHALEQLQNAQEETKS